MGGINKIGISENNTILIAVLFCMSISDRFYIKKRVKDVHFIYLYKTFTTPLLSVFHRFIINDKSEGHLVYITFANF